MREQIIAILSELRPEFDFTENVNFIEEGMLDSFDIVTLVTELEDKFSVTIDGEEVLPENFSSVDSIEALVNKSEKNA
jgi:acyl carrier protein